MRTRWFATVAIAGTLTLVGARGAAAQGTATGGGIPVPGARAGTIMMSPMVFPTVRSPLGFNSFGVQPVFPDPRASLSAGFNPLVATPLYPDIRRPLSGAFVPAAAFPFGTGPVIGGFPSLSQGFNPAAGLPSFSRGFNPALANPTIANPRQPLSGTFNPAPVVPFGAGATVPSTANVPTAFGTSAFGPGGVATPVIIGANGLAYPSAVAIPFPNTVMPQTGAVVAGSPVIVGRRTTRSVAARDARSVRAAQRLMARVPLTEGKVVSADARSVRVRVMAGRAAPVRKYSPGQVFFFTSRGEMLSAAGRRLAPGTRVLVPVTPVAIG
jgi:hypothetical protein